MLHLFSQTLDDETKGQNSMILPPWFTLFASVAHSNMVTLLKTA